MKFKWIYCILLIPILAISFEIILNGDIIEYLSGGAGSTGSWIEELIINTGPRSCSVVVVSSGSELSLTVGKNFTILNVDGDSVWVTMSDKNNSEIFPIPAGASVTTPIGSTFDGIVKVKANKGHKINCVTWN